MFIKIVLLVAVLLMAFVAYRNFSMAGQVPKTESKAPEFSLPDANGVAISLASLQGSWVVLYFYPKDDTPGCTKEACNFRDDMHKLEKLGAKVIGVSVDDGKSHAAFAKKYSLPFPLLSDKDGQVAFKYGALTDLGAIKLAKRYTFLINSEGILKKSYLNVEASQHSQEIIDDLTLLMQNQS